MTETNWVDIGTAEELSRNTEILDSHVGVAAAPAH